MGQVNNLFKANRLILIGLIITLGVLWFRERRPTIEPSAETWFQSEVANEDRPVLVKFGAEWCGPCHVMDESINQVAPGMDRQVKFVRVDVDQNQTLAKHYQVSSIPRTFIFHHGKIIADQKGSLDPESLRSWIETSIAKVPKPS